MIVVRNLQVTTLLKDSFDLNWAIEITVEDVRDFDFFIERSGGQEGPYETIAGPLVDEFFFRDVQAPQYWRGRQFLYRIRVVERATGMSQETESVQAIPSADLIASEIQRLEVKRMLEYAGRKVIYLPRRTFGQRCACWDDEKKRSNSSHCAECFGTGFARGYYKPMITAMHFEVAVGLAGQAERNTDLGKTQHNIVSGRIIITPIAKAGDLIVEAENTRWRVVGKVSYQHLRTPVAQTLTMLQIPDTDIEYRIPIEGIDLATFDFSPPRAFTNPSNIDAVRGGVSRTPA